MRKNYKRDKSFGFYLAVLVIILLLTLTTLTYFISDTHQPLICSFTAFFLSISRFSAGIASGLSASFFTSYLDAIGLIYIGRGDKIFIQTVNGIVAFIITFFLVFSVFHLPSTC